MDLTKVALSTLCEMDWTGQWRQVFKRRFLLPESSLRFQRKTFTYHNACYVFLITKHRVNIVVASNIRTLAPEGWLYSIKYFLKNTSRRFCATQSFGHSRQIAAPAQTQQETADVALVNQPYPTDRGVQMPLWNLNGFQFCYLLVIRSYLMRKQGGLRLWRSTEVQCHNIKHVGLKWKGGKVSYMIVLISLHLPSGGRKWGCNVIIWRFQNGWENMKCKKNIGAETSWKVTSWKQTQFGGLMHLRGTGCEDMY
jgi:hypothetical protein